MNRTGSHQTSGLEMSLDVPLQVTATLVNQLAILGFTVLDLPSGTVFTRPPGPLRPGGPPSYFNSPALIGSCPHPDLHVRDCPSSLTTCSWALGLTTVT